MCWVTLPAIWHWLVISAAVVGVLGDSDSHSAASLLETRVGVGAAMEVGAVTLLWDVVATKGR